MKGTNNVANNSPASGEQSCIYVVGYNSKHTLTITGTGTLNVEGKKYGIYTGGSDIKIQGATVNTTSLSSCYQADGIRTSGSLTIENATVTANGANGISGAGTVIIDGGNISATGKTEGIFADDVTIKGGTVEATENYFGIRTERVSIEDGRLTAKGQDYGIGLSSNVTIQKGTLIVTSERCGIDGSLTIEGGKATVTGSDGSTR